MNAKEIINLVSSLGRTYKDLVAAGQIQDRALIPLFKEGENEDLIYKPAPGMELWFWAETTRLERIVITLIARTEGTSVYSGELPIPFTHKMDQVSIHEKLGKPDHSKGPAKLPPPFGMTGGWDAYRLDQTIHPNAEVAIQFREDRSASGLAFRLIDKGHD
ncbi:DUF6392 family protein [Pseudomonas japonica]|uniref:DUF6392 family protein n=1 Tax=Pseudomonas japonica TaxID=256466 RepID=UPI0005A76CD0|nr:DUF6392 family protein [Pseudomonas japonica]